MVIPFHTSVAGDRPLVALDADETATFCRDYVGHANGIVRDPRRIEVTCRYRAAEMVGATDPDAAVLCEEAKAACITEMMNEPVVARCDVLPTTCTSTVDDFSACWTALANFFYEFLSLAPDCQHLGQPIDAQAVDEMARAGYTACEAYRSGCPE